MAIISPSMGFGSLPESAWRVSRLLDGPELKRGSSESFLNCNTKVVLLATTGRLRSRRDVFPHAHIKCVKNFNISNVYKM